MSTRDFDEAIGKVRKRDPRYARDAYRFMFHALAYSQRKLERPRHVSGQELLEGIRELGLERFGFLAKTVFEHWGLHATDDFGRLVFNLVEANLMGKQDTDTADDFHEVYDFREAFEDGWRLERGNGETADRPRGEHDDASDADADADDVGGHGNGDAPDEDVA